MRVEVRSNLRVLLTATQELPLSRERAWIGLRDIRRCARCDLFHREMHLEGEPRTGTRFILDHAFLGRRHQRVGSIAAWREGEGYVFSDLEAGDPRRGFPHAFSFFLVPLGDDRCRLQIRISGRWTESAWPAWLIRAWMAWNLRLIASRLRLAVLASALELPNLPIPEPWQRLRLG